MNMESSYPELTTMKVVYNGLARRIKVAYDMDWPGFEAKVCALFSIDPPLAASYKDHMGVSVLLDNNDDFWYFLDEEYTGRLDIVTNSEVSAPSEWTVVRANRELVPADHLPGGSRIDSNRYKKPEPKNDFLDYDYESHYSTSGRASTVAKTIPSIPTESPYLSPTPSIPDFPDESPEVWEGNQTPEHFEPESYTSDIPLESPIRAPTPSSREASQETESLGHPDEESIYYLNESEFNNLGSIHTKEQSRLQNINSMSESFERAPIPLEFTSENQEESELEGGCSSQTHVDHSNIPRETVATAPEVPQEINIREVSQETEILGHYDQESLYYLNESEFNKLGSIHTKEQSRLRNIDSMSESFERAPIPLEFAAENQEESELEGGCSSQTHVDHSKIPRETDGTAHEVPQEISISGKISPHSSLNDKTEEITELISNEIPTAQKSDAFDSDPLPYEVAQEMTEGVNAFSEAIMHYEESTVTVAENDSYIPSCETDSSSVLPESKIGDEPQQNNALVIAPENIQDKALISEEVISHTSVEAEAEKIEIDRLRKGKMLRTLCFKFSEVFCQHPALLVTLELFTDQILKGVPIDFDLLENGLRRLAPASSNLNLLGASAESIPEVPLKSSSSFCLPEFHIQANKGFNDVEINRVPSNDQHHRCAGRKKHRSHVDAVEPRAISNELPESIQQDQLLKSHVPMLVRDGSVSDAHSDPIHPPNSIENSIAENILQRTPPFTHTIPSIDKPDPVDDVLVSKLKILHDMGFSDDGVNLEALEANSGNVPKAIEALLSS